MTDYYRRKKRRSGDEVFFWLFILIIFVMIANSGCSKESRYVDRMKRNQCVTMEQRRELASFIIKCSEAANPKSDEEGEDLVIQCERTGINTLCPAVEICREVVSPGGFAQHDRYGDWGDCK